MPGSKDSRWWTWLSTRQGAWPGIEDLYDYAIGRISATEAGDGKVRCRLLALAAFILYRSDPEYWPFGVRILAETLGDREAVEHKLSGLLILAMGVVEWRRVRGTLSHWACNSLSTLNRRDQEAEWRRISERGSGVSLTGWAGWVSGLAGLALLLTSAVRY